MVCMHVDCYSATLRWDRFGRRWAEPPPSRPSFHLQASIYTLTVLAVCLLRTLARNICSLSQIAPAILLSLSLFLALSLFPFFRSSILPRVIPSFPFTPLCSSASSSTSSFVVFLSCQRGWKSRFLSAFTREICDLFFSCDLRVRRCLLRNQNF